MKKQDTPEVQNSNILDYVSMVDIKLLKEERLSTIEILKVGTIHDRGLKITKKMMEDFVSNFNGGVYGTDVQVNFSHDRDGEAAGWIKDVFVEGDVLLAEVEWTPIGIEKIKSKQFRFISSELAISYPHYSTGEKIKNVLIGIALTNIPAVKGLAPVQLSEQVLTYLTNQDSMTKKKELLEEEVKEEVVEEVEEKEVEAVEEEKVEEVEEKVEEEEVVEEEDKVEETEEEKEDLEEEVKEEEKEEEEKEVEEEPKEEVKEELEEKIETVTLTEYQKLEEKLNDLQGKLEVKDLTEDVEDSLVLSQGNTVGFLDDNIEDVVNFMIGLSEEQREAFKGLIGKVRTVDLSTIGSIKSSKAGFDADSVVALAEKLLEEGKAKDIEAAQKMAIAELLGK